MGFLRLKNRIFKYYLQISFLLQMINSEAHKGQITISRKLAIKV